MDEYFINDRVLDIREHNSRGELFIHWRGFDISDDSWEPHSHIAEDMPLLVRNYLVDVRSSGSATQRAIVTSLLQGDDIS